jgi:CheY-like chemotaxis protein
MAPGMRKERVLVLTRDPSRADELGICLGACGFDPFAMEDAHAAMRRVWEEHLPIVVLDLTSPGIDGAFVLRGLKSQPACPKILAIADEAKSLELRRSVRREYRPDGWIAPDRSAREIVERISGVLLLRDGNEVTSAASIDRSFAGVLVALWRQSATGILDVECDSVRTTVYFVNGEPIFAEHGTKQDSLGRMLVRTGLLTEHQLARALNKMNEHLGGNQQFRLGEVLIELGMLSPVQVHEAIAQQVRDKVLACFHSKSILHRFEERDDFIHEVGIFKCPVLPLLFDGVRRAYDPQRAQVILGPRLERYPRLRDDLGSVTDRFGLGPLEQQFLRSITGNRSIASLLEASNLHRQAAAQLLVVMVLADQLELWPDPSTTDLVPREGSQDLHRAPSGLHALDERGSITAEYLRMKGKSDAQVLRVAHNATKDEIMAAFKRGEEQFGPDATRNFPPALARKASEIYALMRSSRDRMLQALDEKKRRSAGNH